MTSLPTELQVLVVGAGPTGLTMALDLAQRGVNVRIIEESAQHHSGARGTAIVPRTQELLAILGAEKDVLATATGPLQMAVYAPDGQTVVKAFEWSEAADESPTIPFRRMAIISQSQLEEILRRHLKTYGCEVEMGKRLTGIVQEDGKVTAKVAITGDTAEHLIESDYLVAADGRSRRFIGVSFLGETKEPDRVWSANVDIPNFSREYWHRWGDFTQAATSLKPLNPAPLFQMQSLGPKLPKDVPMDVIGTQQLFNSITGRDDVKIDNVQGITEWKANIRMTDKFSVGRVFLAGDAAYCHSPAGGQGTNTAMQDAFNLAWKLALVLKGKASPDLLASYEAERMPVVAEMLNLSNQLHAKAFPHIPEAAFDAPQPTGAFPDPMMRSTKMLQLGINYRWSAITFDERDNGERSAEKNPYGTLGDKVRAGDRAPYIDGLQGQDSESTDLFSLLRASSCHLVLLFPASSSTSIGDLESLDIYIAAELIQVAVIVGSQASCRHVEGVQYLVDAQGLAPKAYNIEAKRDVYVTVHPDGIIGAYTFGTKGIHEYFSRLGALA